MDMVLSFKNELNELVRKSEHYTQDGLYPQTEMYKRIDEMYNDDEKNVVDALCEMALNASLDKWDAYNFMSVLYYLFLVHKEDGDDTEYIRKRYREMVQAILDDEKHVEIRQFITSFLNVGFTKKEVRILLDKHLKIETNPIIVERYKRVMLRMELCEMFPEQKGFPFITSVLENNEVKDTLPKIQKLVNFKTKEFGKNIVKEYLNAFVNNKYVKEESKNILLQVKV